MNPLLHWEQVTLLRQLKQLLMQESQRLVALLGKVPLLQAMHSDPTGMEEESQAQVPLIITWLVEQV
jgi:hypothetical protein